MSTDQYIGLFIRHDLVAAILPVMKETLLDCDMNPKLADGLVGINVSRLTGYNLLYRMVIEY